MRNFFIALCCCFPLFAGAQSFTFFVNGKNIEQQTFGSLDSSARLKVVFLNKTAYRFNIASVQLIVRLPQPASMVEQRRYSGVVVTENKTLNNTSAAFSKSPVFEYDLSKVLAGYAGKDYELAFKINRFIASGVEGNDWIDQHLLFNEVPLRRTLSSNPQMSRKGGQ